MTFSGWKESVPLVIREDALWKLKAYQLSLFLVDIAWRDVVKLFATSGMCSLSDQLYRSVGSICANIEEGYSKQSSKDRARFYEYSLGSARESRGWFYRARHVIGEDVAAHRLAISTEIIKLLLTMVPDQRKNAAVCEDTSEYTVFGMLDKKVPFNYGLRIMDYNYE
ncbi:four helix bundle protein [Pontiellaceae bacterium B12219]|nr:four helix bundle protein [Pontiellaceae bacterium B12219]